MRNKAYVGTVDSPEDVGRAAKALQNGGVVIHPTETVYGIAANALEPTAVARVDRLKGSRRGRSYIVLFKNLDMAVAFKVIFHRLALKIATKYWPGPLTLVLPLAKKSPLSPLSDQGTLGVRVSSHPAVRELFEKISFPLISTSANAGGSPPLEKTADIIQQFGGEVEVILDGGLIPKILPSTIAKVSRTKVSLLRRGPLIPVV